MIDLDLFFRYLNECKGGGKEPEHRGPNFRPHSPGGHQDDVHNAVTVPWRRRRVAVGGALDSNREESDQPMTRI